MAKQTTKASKAIVRTELSAALNALCDEFLGVISETVSLSKEMGRITRDAAKLVDEETLPAFIAGCAELCDAAGLTSGSLKVYLANMRGVLRAMLAGWNPEPNLQTLRSLYDAIPAEYRGQGANKGGGRKPRQPKGDKTPDVPTREPVKGKNTEAVLIGAKAGHVSEAEKREARRAAVTLIFGFHSAELEEAVTYAAEHAGIFQTWAKASAKAGMQVPQLRKAA